MGGSDEVTTGVLEEGGLVDVIGSKVKVGKVVGKVEVLLRWCTGELDCPSGLP